jgi:hypothetical protein
MEVMVCFSNIPNKIQKRSNGSLPFWKDPNFIENWQSIYGNLEIIPTQIEGLKFSLVLSMYL